MTIRLLSWSWTAYTRLVKGEFCTDLSRTLGM
jgi:hypothetical protein